METVRTSETSVYSKETTWCYVPEGHRVIVLSDFQKYTLKYAECDYDAMLCGVDPRGVG
jgi:hypothetical protein